MLRAAYVGYQAGLTVEFPKFLGFLGGLFVSFRYAEGLGEALARNTFLSQVWAIAVTQLVVLFIVYFLLQLAFRGLERVGKVDFQSFLEQNGGLLIGFLRGCLVVSFVLVTLAQLPSEYLKSSIMDRSLVGRPMARMAPAVYDTTNAVPLWVADQIRSRP